MSHRDRNNRKTGINDSNRHNKYNTNNKWKNNNWGRNFHNYGSNNYRNSDYGSGHSDFRYDSNWGQTSNPSLWDNDWYNNQHQNFANTNFSSNNFNNNSGNFSRPNRNQQKNLTDRKTDVNQVPTPKSNDPVNHQVEKKSEKSIKDTPSTVTSSSNPQACSSNSVEKTSDNTLRQQTEHNAEQVTKKLIHQLTSMNKHNLKQMINNPSSKYETALQTHARNRLRAEMRTKLQNMSSNQEQQLLNNVLETEESVDIDKIPDNVFDEIGRVLDINLLGQEDNLNKKYYDNDNDKDKDQIAYPEDLFLRAEKLLMENSFLFLEDRLNDSILNVSNDRLDEDRSAIKIKNEIKEEIEDVPESDDIINDENFLEIQGGVNLLNDLVFEDRVGSLSLQNFVEPLATLSDKHAAESSEETNQTPVTSCLIQDKIIRMAESTTTDDNVKDTCSYNTFQSPEISTESSSKQPAQPSTFGFPCSQQTNTGGDDECPIINIKKESHHEWQIVIPSGKTSPMSTTDTCIEAPKKTDLFTKLQNSGAFNSTSTRSKTEPKMVEKADNRRDTYCRKKKKKHKSRSRSISRLRSRSRSKSRSRSSHTNRSKKRSSHERNRSYEATQNIVESKCLNKITDMESDTQPNTVSVVVPSNNNDELVDRFGSIETIAEQDHDKTETYNIEETEENNQLTDPKTNEIQVEQGFQVEDENITNTTDCIIENQLSNDAIETEHSASNVSTSLAEQTCLSDDVNVSTEVGEKNLLIESESMSVQDVIPNITSETTSIVTTSSDNLNESPELEKKNEISDALKATHDAISVVEDESCTSIGSNLAETISITLTSESQSSIADEPAEVISANTSPLQSSNEVATKKIESRPSSSSRHLKDNPTSSSRHKCEKEKHSTSSSKSKKTITSSTPTKKSDQKDNTTISTTNTLGKHQSSHSENSTQRVWRSAGEKKCIEPQSKSSFRNVDIFEPTKIIEPKSSSQRKESGKTPTMRQNKSPPKVPSPKVPSPKVPPPKIELRKSSIAIKKQSTTAVKEAVKEKTSPNHHQYQSHTSDKSLSNSEQNSQHHTAPLLSDSIQISSDNTSVLQRMKEIDLKLMELQVKKTYIDDQIHNLHKEKNVIDQSTIQLQNERFLLLSSLLATNVTNVSNVPSVTNTTNPFNESCQKKVCEAHSSSLEKNVDNKIVTVSSDEDVKITVTKKSIPTKGQSHIPKTLKRKVHDDVSSRDVEKCKKVKINLNPLKPSSYIKNKLKTDDVDDPQSDLKPKYAKTSIRRCSIRLTRFSSKKIKLLTSKDINSDEGSDVIVPAKSIKTCSSEQDSMEHGMIFDGRFFGHKLPIVHLQVVEGFVVAASEDTNIYKHDMGTGKLLGTFTEHTKTVSNFIATENNSLYSVSLDGFLKKFSLKNFDTQLLSIHIGEALQVMEYSWDTAFIGSRSGKIYLFDTKMDTLAEECLCSVGKSIMALKATKEGPRKILIASSRCHNINVRDATSGLLLRTIEVPDKLTIYSIHLDGGQLYCGTNKNLVFRYEFTSGNEISRIKLGTGTICLKSYKNSIILGGCYDGYIYSYDTKSEIQLSRFPGPGKMLLHFDVYGDKIIAASKDKSLRVLDIPDDIVLHER